MQDSTRSRWEGGQSANTLTLRQAKAMADAGDERGWASVDVGEGRMEAGLPRALVEQLRQLLRPRRFARRMQVLRSIEQRVPG